MFLILSHRSFLPYVIVYVGSSSRLPMWLSKRVKLIENYYYIFTYMYRCNVREPWHGQPAADIRSNSSCPVRFYKMTVTLK